MKASVAGAPVSFGVFELTPAGAETIGADDMMGLLASSGYEGIDLGPLGFLGLGSELRDRLARHGLELAGGWVQLPFSDDDAFDAALPTLTSTLNAFSDAVAMGVTRAPLPTLADDGSLLRRTAPGRGSEVDQLNRSGWSSLVQNAERAALIVRAAGFEPTFHHHAGTFVESPDEIDRFLAAVDIGLTLDTGHLVLGGGDPLKAVNLWGDRINHVHLKDVDVEALRRVIGEGGNMADVWSSGAFTAFGSGHVDLTGVLDALESRGYDGWIVVEQDVLNGPDVSLDDFRLARAADQTTNREALRTWV